MYITPMQCLCMLVGTLMIKLFSDRQALSYTTSLLCDGDSTCCFSCIKEMVHVDWCDGAALDTTRPPPACCWYWNSAAVGKIIAIDWLPGIFGQAKVDDRDDNPRGLIKKSRRSSLKKISRRKFVFFATSPLRQPCVITESELK
ncbi:hypothetical protein EGR_07459 [Echinococcus granulosus]|uniref:Uncharacterized protein n=1 Tax=Echinococcus granulosus TaxID=6210 RepID=W6UHT2_ECHGR|nr:hypothetical protein EGR_07459 [Echinococcus granulosus]EUB57652.1 hypothetical protein EGR_07459 [Echinococcus granulosus]